MFSVELSASDYLLQESNENDFETKVLHKLKIVQDLACNHIKENKKNYLKQLWLKEMFPTMLPNDKMSLNFSFNLDWSWILPWVSEERWRSIHEDRWQKISNVFHSLPLDTVLISDNGLGLGRDICQKIITNINCKHLDLSQVGLNTYFEAYRGRWQVFMDAIKTIRVNEISLKSAFTGNSQFWLGNYKGRIQADALCDALSEIKVEKLTLSVCWITSVSWLKFGKALTTAGVKNLGLIRCLPGGLRMPIDQWQVFGDEVLNKANIEQLDLSCNDFSLLEVDEWQKLSQVIKASQVISLKFNETRILSLEQEKWQIFCDMLKNSKIISIELNNSPFHKERLVKLKTIIQLKNRPTLKARIMYDLILRKKAGEYINKHCSAQPNSTTIPKLSKVECINRFFSSPVKDNAHDIKTLSDDVLKDLEDYEKHLESVFKIT
jgi:hypothetical protein